MSRNGRSGKQKSYYLETAQVETIAKVAVLEDRSENQVLRRVVAAGFKALGIPNISIEAPE